MSITASDREWYKGAAVVVLAAPPLLTVTVEDGGRGEAEIHLHAGGQGFWIARMIASFGLPVTLCSTFGGETGVVARTLIEREHVSVRAVESAIANGSYVHDRRGGVRTEIATTGAGRLSRHELDELYGAVLVAGLDARTCVLAGAPDDAIPSEFYRRLASDLRTNGTLAVADLSGTDLEHAIAGGVQVVKISHEELVRDGYARSNAVGDVLEGIVKLRALGAQHVVVSRAGDPVIAAIDDELLEIRFPRLDPFDHRGAGDSMTAMLTAALAAGRTWPEALRLAVAAGSLNVTRRGLATGRRDQIEQFAEHVDVLPLTSPIS